MDAVDQFFAVVYHKKRHFMSITGNCLYLDDLLLKSVRNFSLHLYPKYISAFVCLCVCVCVCAIKFVFN